MAKLNTLSTQQTSLEIISKFEPLTTQKTISRLTSKLDATATQSTVDELMSVLNMMTVDKQDTIFNIAAKLNSVATEQTSTQIVALLEQLVGESSKEKASPSTSTTDKTDAECRALSEELIRHRDCPLCMSNHWNIALQPCGHLICETCMTERRFKTCPTCRTSIRRHMLVYPS